MAFLVPMLASTAASFVVKKPLAMAAKYAASKASSKYMAKSLPSMSHSSHKSSHGSPYQPQYQQQYAPPQYQPQYQQQYAPPQQYAPQYQQQYAPKYGHGEPFMNNRFGFTRNHLIAVAIALIIIWVTWPSNSNGILTLGAVLLPVIVIGYMGMRENVSGIGQPIRK